MWNNHHTQFHRNPMNKESGVIRDEPLFSQGGIMISWRKESFFHHRLSTCKFSSSTPAVQTIILKFPKSCITYYVVSADNFFPDPPMAQTIFFPITISRGKIMVYPLCWQIPPPPAQVR